MRSLFAVATSAWFAVQAASFIAEPHAYPNSNTLSGIDGDPGAVAITMAARMLFVGLAILSLAFVEWGTILAAVRDLLGNNDRPS